MEGYVAATNNKFTRIYFIIWFIISVVVVMNVCAGFLIDAYSLLKPKMANEVKWLDKILMETSKRRRRKKKKEKKGQSTSLSRLFSKETNIVVENNDDNNDNNDQKQKEEEEEEEEEEEAASSSTKSCLRWCGDVSEYERLQCMSMNYILSHIDTEHMVSNMPSVSRASKDNILFDQQLQHQLGIRVVEHEHSYSQLTKVFDEGEDTDDDDDDDDDEVENGNYN